MKQLTINKGKTWFVFLIVILQIFIMINTVAAQSYILKESYSLNVEAFIEENKNKEGIFSKTTGFLFWFFEIKQISTVSAQESSDTNCCVETNSGALCQEVSSDYEGCENILPTSCEETSVCQVGTCIIEEGLSCSANSPKQKC